MTTMSVTISARRGIKVGLLVIWAALTAIVHGHPTITFVVGNEETP